MARRFIYLINPVAGTRKKTTLRKLIMVKTTQQNIPFEILESDIDGNYQSLVDKITKEGVSDVIVCGGDGTVNSVVAHILNTHVNIGIIPFGSGNGLARTAGIPLSPEKALEIIFRGKVSKVDGFYINDQFSCMLSGIGFDAQVAHDFANKTKRGLKTYIKVAAFNYFKARPYPFIIRSKQVTIAADAYFVCIANSNQFGNNFTIAPKASLSDGLLDIVVMKKMSKFMLPFSIFSHVAGMNRLQNLSTGVKKRNVIYFQTTELVIENLLFAPLHIDGEPMQTNQVFNIRVFRNAFNLLQP